MVVINAHMYMYTQQVTSKLVTCTLTLRRLKSSAGGRPSLSS